ncbi:MAG: OsmC family protein [Ignavibacteriales bacterium]
MSVETVRVKWKGATTFECSLPTGKNIIMEGSGPKPLETMISSLGGCAAMTLIAFAEKMRLPLDRLEVDVDGVLADEKVHALKGAHIKYRLWGAGLEEQQVKRLLELTEKYCPVYNTLIHAGPIGHTFEINP